MGLLDYLNFGTGQAGAAAQGQNGQDFGSRQTGTWDTTRDAAVGSLDSQIKAYTNNHPAGSAGYDQTVVDDLSKQRRAANVARWQTAQLQGNPAYDQLSKQLSTGALSYNDLGDVDISAMSSPDQLQQQVNGILAKKALPPPTAPTAPAPAPVDQAAADAQSSVGGLLGNVMTEANSALDPNNPNSALGVFDAKAQSDQNLVSSTATRSASRMGIADAGAQANQAGTNLTANNAAGRDLTAKDSMAVVNDYVNKHLNTALNESQDVASMKVDERVKLQTHTVDALTDQLKAAIGTGNADANAQMDQLDASIKKWKNAADGSAEQNAEWMKILGIGAGVVMMAGGAALSATGGGAAVGAPLIAGGLAQTARSA